MGRLLIAGFVAMVLSVNMTPLERTFMIPLELQAYGTPYPPGILEKIDAAQATANQKNMGLIGGLVGAIVCSLLCVATIPGPVRSVIAGAVTGVMTGAVFGAVGGALSAMLFGHFVVNSIDPFVDSMLAQGCLTIAIGVALGLTLKLTATAFVSKQGLLLVIIVAALSSVLYPFVSAVLFPLLKSGQAVPEGMVNRGLWLGMPIMGCAVAIAVSRPVKSAATLPEGSAVSAAD